MRTSSNDGKSQCHQRYCWAGEERSIFKKCGTIARGNKMWIKSKSGSMRPMCKLRVNRRYNAGDFEPCVQKMTQRPLAWRLAHNEDREHDVPDNEKDAHSRRELSVGLRERSADIVRNVDEGENLAKYGPLRTEAVEL